MKLAIISHTQHYKDANGNLVGWGPTISEINHLSNHFEEIYHIAFLYKSIPPPSALPYTNKNITFVPLPISGGKNLIGKFSILKNLGKTINIVRQTLKKVDAFQLRTPTGIGTYLIPYLTYFQKNKKGWFKYAGNWVQENPPLGYAIQRNLLKKQSRIVTINGKWPDQKKHCYTFENPCLTLEERVEGFKVIENKIYEKPFSFCFVGRLEDEKGVQIIIDTFSAIRDKSFLEIIHFIGDGSKMAHYKKSLSKHNIPACFHGFVNRDAVFKIYNECDFILLPSASEGFPKVIAEGLNFGCIPIVSDVSSIGQYISAENGFLINPLNKATLIKILKNIALQSPEDLKKMAINGRYVSEKFTFKRYINRILLEILTK